MSWLAILAVFVWGVAGLVSNFRAHRRCRVCGAPGQYYRCRLCGSPRRITYDDARDN